MSTRSIIAIQNKTGFKGGYHHWDGYPTGLGEYLFDTFQEDGWAMVEKATSHSWSSFMSEECHCCGTMSDGRTEEFWVADENTDCGAEYVYAFLHESWVDNTGETKHNHFMNIYARKLDGKQVVEFFGMTTPNAQWELISSVDLNGKKPDFKKIEQEQYV